MVHMTPERAPDRPAHHSSRDHGTMFPVITMLQVYQYSKQSMRATSAGTTFLFVFVVSSLVAYVQALTEIYISYNGSDKASCGSFVSPCSSLSNISHLENDTVIIIEGSIVLDRVIKSHLIRNLTFTSLSAAKRNSKEMAAINCVCPPDSCGLIINDCQDVTFNDISIIGCSLLHKLNVQGTYLYRSGIIINATTNILMNTVKIVDNIGTGLLLINSAGTINITDCTFANNSVPYTLQIHSNNITVHGGAGLMILISGCDVMAENCSHASTSGNYIIQSTKFNNNTSNLTSLSSRDWLFSYGGGLGILLVWNVQGNTFNIELTNFTSNKASVGGGMILHCEKHCYDNTAIIKNCFICYNSLTIPSFGGAGLATGIALHSENVPFNNNVTIVDTTIAHNTGYYGGGVLVYCNAMDLEKQLKAYNYVHFIKSRWENNSGTVSPAVEVEPNFRSQLYNVFTTKTIFEDCSFINNTIMRFYNSTIRPSYTFKEGIGVFIITRLTVYFKGINTFSNNSGTALYILTGSAYFEKGAVTVFNNNTGSNGGAVGLVGYSNMQYNNDTLFIFNGNSASFIGGAIYVLNTKSHTSLSSHSCFLHFLSNGESSYGTNSRFIFKNNWSSTGIANSIFITTIAPCQFACLSQSGFIPKTKDLFVNQSCIGKFEFHSRNERSEIASGGSLFNFSHSTPLSVIPGRKYSLPLTLLDDMGQDVTRITIFQPSLSNVSKINVSSGFEFVANNTIALTGIPGNNGNLTLSTSSFQNTGISASIGVQLASCPPGYIIDYHASSCVCSATQNNKSVTYDGIVSCKESEGVSLAVTGYWVGYILSNESDIPNQYNLYVADCPTGFCHNYFRTTINGKNQQYYRLSKSASQKEMEEIVCAENRQGTICSQCKEGYSVYFHSETAKCGNNRLCHIGIIFYIISEIIPITGLFFVIIFFNISLTTGLAYSFLFMMQLQQSMVVSVNGGVNFEPSFIRSIYSVLYNILNLDFFHIDELSFCLWKGASMLDMIIIKYVSVFYAILLIIAFVYLFKHCKCGQNNKFCRKKITTKYSLVQGLAAFIVISYFQCSWVTFMLLNRQLPRGIGGIHYKDVVFWNGSLGYFSAQHILYAIPALLCLILFVIPFPLILSLDGLFLKVESKLADHFDFIRKLRPWTAIHYRSKPLLDSFQGTFKDRYRFFSGFYFCYRLLILTSLVMTSNVLQYYFVLEVALILIIVIQAIVQPFQKNNHNVCALLIFTNMALINAFTIRIFYLVSTDGYTTETILMQWIQVVLIYIPLITGIVWGFWKLCKKCHSKYNTSTTGLLTSSVDVYGDGYIACDNDFPGEIFNRSENEND